MATISAKNLRPRKALEVLLKQLSRDNILVILGSRQVGKTSLLALLYQQAGNQQKVYFDLEDIQLLNDLNEIKFDDFPIFLTEQARISSNKKTCVFIDEIQYLNNPSSFLKYIFDHYKKIKFIVSGSSTLEIKKKFSDRLTGRKYLKVLYPLDLAEFLDFKQKKFNIKEEISLRLLAQENRKITPLIKKKLSWDKKELAGLFQEFVLYGGYPRAVLAKSKEEKIAVLKEIHSTYIRKDIKDLAEIENIKVYNDLVDILASQSANLLNVDELTDTLNSNRKTVEKYLFLLENTFIVNLLKPFFTNKRKEITKMPKVLLKDTGLRNMLIKNFSPLETRPDKGALIENFVYTELKKNLNDIEELYFWRTQTQAEVDFVIKGKQGRLIPIEVKYKKTKKAQIPSGLRSFIAAYDVKTAFVITENLLDELRIGKTKVYFLPAFLI